MRHIDKEAEPNELLEYRTQPNASYGGIPKPVKDAMREQLMQEQGYLCAYCMRRLDAVSCAESPGPRCMKIEHWIPQSGDANQQLVWSNLLGVCQGGEGSPPHLQHCDTSKADDTISIHPCRQPERFLHYLNSGEIKATSIEIQHDIDNVLRLNLESLKAARRATIDALIQALKQRKGKGFKASALKTKIESLKTKKNQRYQPYIAVMLSYLERKLDKVQGIKS